MALSMIMESVRRWRRTHRPVCTDSVLVHVTVRENSPILHLPQFLSGLLPQGLDLDEMPLLMENLIEGKQQLGILLV